MKKFMAIMASVSALAVTSGLASAATFGGTGYSAGFDCTSTATASNIDVLVGATFNSTFYAGDSAGSMCFNLNNTSATSVAVTLVGASVNQLGTSYGFNSGVTLSSPPTGTLWTVAQGAGGFQNFTFNIGAGQSMAFNWTYGAAYSSGQGNPQINFGVIASPVPLPATGLLLLGGLGALGVAKRRKKKAADA